MKSVNTEWFSQNGKSQLIVFFRKLLMFHLFYTMSLFSYFLKKIITCQILSLNTIIRKNKNGLEG